MKKTIIIYITIILLLPLVVNAQPEWEWIQILEEFPYSSCEEVIAIGNDVAAFGWGTNDDGRHLLCAYYEEDGTLANFAAIRTGASVEMQVVRANDGGFVIKDGNRLRKISFDFEEIWFRDLHEDQHSIFLDITACEGGYALAGQIKLDNGQVHNGWFLKIDEDGEIIEENIFFDYLEEGDNYAKTELNSIAVHPDGGFIVGYEDYYIDDLRRVVYYSYLLHLGDEGDSLNLISEVYFSKIYPTNYNILLLFGGGVRRISYDGDSFEEAEYYNDGLYYIPEGIALSQGGGGIICGMTTDLDDDDELIFPHIFIVRFDDQLEESWRLYYTGRYRDCRGNSVTQADDGSYYVGGHIARGIAGGEIEVGLTVLKTEVDPAFVDNIDNPRYPRSLIVDPAYPNPFNGQTILNFQTNQANNIITKIIDLQGRVLHNYSGFFNAGNHQLTINSDGLNSGTFIIQLSNGRMVQTHKITVLK